MIKMSKLIKQQNDQIRKQTGMIKEDTKVPADIKIFMDKFINRLRKKNLNRAKTKEILVQVLKGLGIDAKELTMYISRVKKEL